MESAVAMNDLAIIVDLLGILTLKPYVKLYLSCDFNLMRHFSNCQVYSLLFTEQCGTWIYAIPYWGPLAISYKVNTKCEYEKCNSAMYVAFFFFNCIFLET